MTSFSEYLKIATWSKHEQLEQLPFGNHLAKGTLPLKGYILQLQAYYIIHRELEQACRLQPSLKETKIWTEELVKTTLLKADLEDLGAECLEDMPETQRLVKFIKNSQSLDLIGILYVFEGSTMGAVAMYPTICRTYQLSEKGTRYFKGYGEHTRSHWNAFKENLNLALEDDEALVKAIVIAGAQRTFEEVSVLFTALWDNIQH
jgi:heme oxygenase